MSAHLIFGALTLAVLAVACLQLSDASLRHIPQQKIPVADTLDAAVLVAQTHEAAN